MCGHQWRKLNDVYICVRCGLTKTYDGKIIFDRRLPSKLNKKEKRKR